MIAILALRLMIYQILLVDLVVAGLAFLLLILRCSLVLFLQRLISTGEVWGQQLLLFELDLHFKGFLFLLGELIDLLVHDLYLLLIALQGLLRFPNACIELSGPSLVLIVNFAQWLIFLELKLDLLLKHLSMFLNLFYLRLNWVCYLAFDLAHRLCFLYYLFSHELLLIFNFLLKVVVLSL